jgi:ankyrin repeat protein
MEGELYEVKFAALLFTRGLNSSEDFQLACNVDYAGYFDDIVFKLGKQMVFIQLKHRKNTKKKIKLQQLTKKHGKFSLVRYFESYCQMKQQWENSEDMQYCGKFKDFFFGIYTNAVISKDVGNDVHNTDLHNILSSGGRCISFTEDSSLMKHFTDLPDFKEFLPDSPVFKKSHVDLSDFKNFLSQLLFFTGQAAQSDLDDLIGQEIECLYGTRAVYSKFLIWVQYWWQNSNYYLTNQIPFWKDIFQACVDNISEEKHKEIEVFGIRFKEDKLDVIRRHLILNQMLHVIPEGAGDCAKLSCLKVHQSLSTQCHILVDGKTLQSRWSEVLAQWGRFCDFLVVVEADSMDIDTLIDVLLKCPSKRLVVIAGTVTWDKLQPKYATFHDHIAVRQLDEVSQNKVLAAEVSFQGCAVPLRDVIGSNHNLVPADVIIQILTQKLVLGEALTSDIQYYIPRNLQHTVQVKEQILFHRAVDSAVIFAVSGMSYPELQQLMPSDRQIYMSHNHDLYKNKCKIEAISTEDEFLKLSESCQTVHWLHRERNVFIWKKSYGDTSIVLKYLTQFEHIDSVMDVPYCVTLVSAEPGMGKSTLLTHLALGTKKAHPAMWVVRVNLIDFTQHLEKLPENLELRDVIEFLLKVSGITEKWKTLFSWKLETMNNICVLFDGYDEISPDHADKVALMLKILQANKLQKLWVTTRPVMKEKLQSELFTWALTLQPFLKSDQQKFLAKFWKKSVPEIEEPVLNTFITKLLQLTATNLNDRDRHFMEVPLQCMLLAEAFENNLRTYSEKRLLILPQKFDLFQLYKGFLNRKLDILNEKNKVDNTKPLLKQFCNTHKQKLKENHMITALFLLLRPSFIKEFPDPELMANIFKSFIGDIQNGGEQTGIIKQISEGKPVFIHRTFAEYFAALWFAENFKNIQSYMNIIMFDPNFQVVRYFFNRILAQERPLHVAVLNHDKFSVETLLSEQKDELDVNKQDEGGRTALHLAVMSLTDIHADDPSRSEMQQMIDALLRHGADLSIMDEVLCWRPLRVAESIREWSVVDLLLERQADREDLVLTRKNITNKKEEYVQDALIAATRYGLVQLVAFMLECGVGVGHTINVLCEESDCTATMLHEAAHHGREELVQFLLDHNADTAARDSRYDRSALMWAAKQGHFQVVDVLTKKSTDINMCDMRGYTALLIAAKNKRWDVTKLLSQRGGNVKTCDWSGSNVLHFAAESGPTEFVAYLLDMGQIDIECRNKYEQTPLWLAARSGRLEVTQLLLEHRANLYVQDMKGCTPLHVAAAGGHLHIVQVLLQHDARPSV